MEEMLVPGTNSFREKEPFQEGEASEELRAKH